jgi:hypothetical protein
LNHRSRQMRCAVLSAALMSFSLRAAHAEPPDVAAHMAFAAQALQAEVRGDHTAEVTACNAALDAAPEGPRAPRCTARLTRLAAYQDADGGFTSLAALEAVRKQASAAPDAARAALINLLSSEDVPTAVQDDAALWLAADDLERLHDPASCLDRTDALFRARARLERAQLEDLVSRRARALAQLGRVDEANAVLDEVRVNSPAPRPTAVDQELVLQRDANRRRLAWGTVVTFALLAALRATRVRPAGPPWGLLPLGVSAVSAWTLAEQYAEGEGRPVGPIFLALSAVHLLAWRAAAGRGWAGAVVSVAAVAASIAATWLALDAVGVGIWGSS